jgi:hypothetical protein
LEVGAKRKFERTYFEEKLHDAHEMLYKRFLRRQELPNELSLNT